MPISEKTPKQPLRSPRNGGGGGHDSRILEVGSGERPKSNKPGTGTGGGGGSGGGSGSGGSGGSTP
jgi:hypothetical protein